MGNIQPHLLVNSASALLRQLRDVWNSPRGTVIRIEALALVAIALSFFLAVFGSCRRWSNRWLLQKGFLAANGLSLSLGTYSILYCGYVLFISFSTTSSRVDNKAIGVLSAITLIKGFHRALALLQPIGNRNLMRKIAFHRPRQENVGGFGGGLSSSYVVSIHRIKKMSRVYEAVTIEMVWRCNNSAVATFKDVCLSLSLSHLLQQRFYKLTDDGENEPSEEFSFKRLLQTDGNGGLDYQRAFKVIEVELAFFV
jgi:hypothetical protein